MKLENWKRLLREAERDQDLQAIIRLHGIRREVELQNALGPMHRMVRRGDEIEAAESDLPPVGASEYQTLLTYAKANHAIGTDLYRLAEALAQGPADFDWVCERLAIGTRDRTEQTKAFNNTKSNLNKALSLKGQGLEVSKDGPNLVIVKRVSPVKRRTKRAIKKT